MEKSDPILDGSKRFGTFREGLIKQIPRLPNDRVSLTALRSKNHTELLIIYMSWRLRHVAVRARKVVGLSILEDDPRSAGLKANIKAFAQAVEAGADLAPYLSKRAHREGYVMDADPTRTNTATWADKDFLLNVMGATSLSSGSSQGSQRADGPHG